MQAFIVENGIVVQSLMLPDANWPVSAGETLVVSDVGGIGWRLIEGKIVDPVTVISDEQARLLVDIERDRRISAGFSFKGVTYQSRLPGADHDGIRGGDWEIFSGKALEAFIAVMAGAQPGDLRWSTPDEDFAWIAADNSRVSMDAQTVVELCKTASAHRTAHTFAGSDLKALADIPTDYTDDKWWP